MKILFAPLEGITYPEYRFVHSSVFGGADEYYCPFVTPSGSGDYKIEFLKKRLGKISGEAKVIPQILANSPEAFSATARLFSELGCDEVNLNAGCPSGTVVSKHKGAGMLSDLDSLRRFLEKIYENADVRISIKTRMGVDSTDEFDDILEVYNDFPVSKLIVHARDRKGLYKSKVDIEGFGKAAGRSQNPVYYNGDIFSVSDADALTERYPEIAGIMVGRGAVADPALLREISGGPGAGRDEMKKMHDMLLDEFVSSGLTLNYIVERMKNLWKYMYVLYPGHEKEFKAINKCKRFEDYRSISESLLKCEIDPNGKFSDGQ